MKIDVKGAIVPSDEGWIYDYFGMECTYPKKINKAILDAKGEDLDVEINSGGGDVFAGSEIYNALRTYTGNVRIHVVGLAASAASVIMCAGHSDASPTAQIMVHNVSMYTCGDHNDMDHAADILRTADRSIAAAYVAKTGMTEAEALKLMNKETWLTAQDAVDIGLIDEITNYAQETEPVRLAASAEGLLPRDVINKMSKERLQLQMDLLKMKGESSK